MQGELLWILLVEYLHKSLFKSKILIIPELYPTNKKSRSSVISKQFIVLSETLTAPKEKNFSGYVKVLVIFFSFKE